MELLQEIRTFENEAGKVVFFPVYYVEVCGLKVYLKVVNEKDKSLLKVSFDGK